MSANVTNGKARPLAILIALTGWVAVFLQLYLSTRLSLANGRTIGWALVAYFGYFTVLTNWLVCFAMTWPWVAPSSVPGQFFARPVTIGWVTASIVFVGIGYHFLLYQPGQLHGLHRLANALLHYATPILCAIYSLIVLRGVRLRWTAPWWWAIYLALYFAYVLIRGGLIGIYPYAFIDVSQLGYLAAVRNACLLLVAFLVLSYLLIAVWRVGGKR
jgi:hypothetical protein